MVELPKLSYWEYMGIIALLLLAVLPDPSDALDGFTPLIELTILVLYLLARVVLVIVNWRWATDWIQDQVSLVVTHE